MELSARPTWDEYFLSLAFHVSIRSEDPDIKHGAVIVNKDNHILGTGYNGPVRGSDNSKIPFHIRDEKRKWMIHAEENAILNTVLRQPDCRIYITGQPCNSCLQRIINFGIKKIIFADRVGTITNVNEESKRMNDILLEMGSVSTLKISLDNQFLKKFSDLF
jgi:dCMP deaminase